MNAMSAAAYQACYSTLFLVRYPLLWYTALLKGFYLLLANVFPVIIMASNRDLSSN